MTLGHDIEKYRHLIGTERTGPIPDTPFLSEAHLLPEAIPGVRGGSLTWGNCANKDKVVRVKLKFHDRNHAFFEELHEEYVDAFGKPKSYKGDSFRNVIAWEWEFIRDGERVTLLLMWSRDRSMRPGVSIKMTLASLVEQEYDCFKRQMDSLEASRGGPSKIRAMRDFIPH